MHHPSRPSHRSDGSSAVTPAQGSGGDPPPAGAAGASAQTSRSDSSGETNSGHPCSTGGGEPDSPSRRRKKSITPPDSLVVFQTRSIFYRSRRPSSGYFSYDGDSVPNSPHSPWRMTADKATQTPSPTGQVMQHAIGRMAEPHGGGPGRHQQHGSSPGPFSTWSQNAAGDMQMEAIGRELRRIGDDYDRLVHGRRRQAVIHLNPLPHIHQETALLFCMGLLFLLIGRIIYSQGSTDS